MSLKNMRIRHRSALLDSSKTSKSTVKRTVRVTVLAMNMGTNDVQDAKNPELDSVTLDKV